MEVKTEYLTFNTKGYTDIIDITAEIQKLLVDAGFKEGNVTISATGSTAGITTIEYEPGLVKTDLAEMFNKIAPYGVPYEHNKTWGDDNGAAHLRASLLGSSLTIPFQDSQLIVGTWQQIIFVDFDTRPRSRKVVVQIIGTK